MRVPMRSVFPPRHAPAFDLPPRFPGDARHTQESTRNPGVVLSLSLSPGDRCRAHTAEKPLVIEWRIPGSNRWPPACKADQADCRSLRLPVVSPAPTGETDPRRTANDSPTVVPHVVTPGGVA